MFSVALALAAAQGASYPAPGEFAMPAPPARRADRPAAEAPAASPIPPADQPVLATPRPGFDNDGPPPPVQAVKYDNVGYARASAEAGGVAAAHPSLPPGSFAEVTALDTGRTILVPITAVARPGAEIELSGAAAQELGIRPGPPAAVRVRVVTPTPPDLVALREGRPAAQRPDTPPVLLIPLRKRLAGTQGQAAPPPPRPTYTVASPPPAVVARPAPRAPVAGGGYWVQVAALSDLGRARSAARGVGGTVASGGGFHRVRAGPYPDERSAAAARATLARRYPGATIIRP